MANYTLAQIKSHPSFPFTDFESNPLAFLMLELYWSQLFAELMGDYGKNWSSTIEAEMDGNPIFCATSLSLKREIRVIHKVNRENKPAYPVSVGEGTYYGLQAWLNKGFTVDGRTALNELVLYADLSPETEKEASTLIRLHCIELANEAAVERAIAEYEERVQMPE